MKKEFCRIAVISMIIGFTMAGCNAPVGPGTGGPGENTPGTDVTTPVDHLYVMGSSDDYPGAEVDLADIFDDPLVDISQYSSVSVKATLYVDEEGKIVATEPSGSNKNLAQFTLLKASGGWNDSSNKCGPTKYGMAIDGTTVLDIPNTAAGVPGVLLLQANWADFKDDGVKVKSILIHNITFTAKTGDINIKVLYDKGDYLTTSGNEITFNNAMYSDAAALYAFPASWGVTEDNADSLAGKTIKFSFTILAHTCVPCEALGEGQKVEHQIHIQAAHDDSSEDKFNGKNSEPGQQYIDLGSSADGTNCGAVTNSFSIQANKLIAASQVAGNENDCKGPFVLNAVRIVNNGTKYTTDIRCKSYTVVFDNIELK